MEKVNVYDWDKTIFPVDSTVAFVRWCLRRHPGVIWPLLRALALRQGIFRREPIRPVALCIIFFIPIADLQRLLSVMPK